MKKASLLFVIFVVVYSTRVGAQNDSLNTTKKSEIYTLVEQMPEYPGGMPSLYKFIGENIRFPERCKTDSSFTSCKVFLKMVINEEGFVASTEVIKGCKGFPECDKEALRVLALLQRWKPGMQMGKPVKVYYTLPINFKLQ